MIEDRAILKSLYLLGIRKEFPILDQQVNGHPLVYLDNAATTQKPLSVIHKLEEYYKKYNANIHRGVHTLANLATEAFEQTRKKAASFVNADEKEIVITKGTTEGINLVANSWGVANLRAGDEILVSLAEHHSNIVPWQILAKRMDCKLVTIPINSQGTADLEKLQESLGPKSKILAINYVSNALGTINPIKEVLILAKSQGCKVLVDGAQAAAHIPIDVKGLGIDFFAFSGHKMYGPTGVGFLYGKYELLEQMPPFMGGGEMIKEVRMEESTYLDPPLRFEAGTPNIADVIAMKEAFEFLEGVDKNELKSQEDSIIEYSNKRMAAIPGLKLFGTSPEKVSLFSFTLDGIHPFDAGQLLDSKGIAVRTGHHCTMPLMENLGLEGTIRASFGIYNTLQEAEILWDTVEHIQKKYGSVG